MDSSKVAVRKLYGTSWNITSGTLLVTTAILWVTRWNVAFADPRVIISVPLLILMNHFVSYVVIEIALYIAFGNKDTTLSSAHDDIWTVSCVEIKPFLKPLAIGLCVKAILLLTLMVVSMEIIEPHVDDVDKMIIKYGFLGAILIDLATTAIMWGI